MLIRKDKLLKSFLEHELLVEKYGLDSNKIPQSVGEALKSNIPIVQTIAMIIDNLEKSKKENSGSIEYTISDTALKNLVTEYLNINAI